MTRFSRFLEPVILLALAVAVIVGSATWSKAQGGDVLYSAIDIPQAGPQTILRQSFAVHGWAFNCSKGMQQPYWVQVQLFAPNGQVTLVPVQRYGTLYRPDVKAAYAAACVEASSFVGYALVPLDWQALPTGTFTLVVVWADTYGATYAQRQQVTLQ